jgi:hypothetical protein
VKNKEHLTYLDDIEKIIDRMNRKRDLDSQYDDPLRFKEIVKNISSMDIVSNETIKHKALQAERREYLSTMLNSSVSAESLAPEEINSTLLNSSVSAGESLASEEVNSTLSGGDLDPDREPCKYQKPNKKPN